ncbi:GMC family oxidoreductase [Paenibacillus sp. LHD-117]|uniref:GMC family oxidoreductase n=1 Tax=Paenibacillus sp. LHD-117 TaxID=3071412 RepID=UPI0027DEC8D4|nr:GMC family oxidoreductase [Paenibacillus sp. LHD-117]MDQ6421632.1 GMC family oxidoreductase [Paenibacillus sp. LHD-117]
MNGIPPYCPPDSRYLKEWIPTIPLEEMAKHPYDVLIVGSGAGGGAALWRLCERLSGSGKRIAVVEAGDLLLPTHAMNVATLSGFRAYEYFINPEISQPYGNLFPDLPGAREVFALGGKTLFWTGVSPRFDASELTGWPVSPNEMAHYYAIAEQVMNVTPSFGSPSSLQHLIIQRLRESGFPDAVAAPLAMNREPIQFGMHFSSISFLAYALRHRPFELAVRSRAVRVLSDGRSVIGVEAMSQDKKTYRIRAQNVILSANSYETPRLLLHSGINGTAIGHYLVNHSRLFQVSSAIIRNASDLQSFVHVLIPHRAGSPYQIQIGRIGIPDMNAATAPFIMAGFGKVETRYENFLYLDPFRKDSYGVPLAQVQFSYSDADIHVIRQTAEAMKRAWAGISGQSLSNDSNICLGLPGSDYHEAGTCRMGTDPRTSSANPFGQIHGVSGLYVADNSVLPSVGATNPTLTTVALAIRTADAIIHRLK